MGVTIHRKASTGVDAMVWKRRIQFDPKDGLFEFKEDQMQLENGFLQLVFRAYSFQSRAVRFPQHYSLASTDVDACWEYSAESEGGESVREFTDSANMLERPALLASPP